MDHGKTNFIFSIRKSERSLLFDTIVKCILVRRIRDKVVIVDANVIMHEKLSYFPGTSCNVIRKLKQPQVNPGYSTHA